MATVLWSPLGPLSANLAPTQLNNLANGSTSAVLEYNNSTTRWLHGRVSLILGSFTPVAGGSVVLRVIGHDGTAFEDVVESGHIESYAANLTTTATAKRVVFKQVPLHPWQVGFTITNRSGTVFAASGHSFIVGPFGEDVT